MKRIDCVNPCVLGLDGAQNSPTRIDTVKARVVCGDEVNDPPRAFPKGNHTNPTWCMLTMSATTSEFKKKEKYFVSGILFLRVSNYLFNNARWLTEKDSEENNS